MGDVVRLLVNAEIWIYALLGVIGIIYFGRLISDWREKRSAIFGLEREGAHRRLVLSATVVVLLLITAAAELFVVSFVAPSYPMTDMLPTPTLDLMTTPTATLAPGVVAPLVVPTISADISSGCIAGSIDWTSPFPGEELSGVIELTGTVNVLNLGFYKYEFSTPGQDTWTTIAGGNIKKVEEPLGNWDTGQRLPGDYLLRLVVTDNEGNALPPCIIPVKVIGEE